MDTYKIYMKYGSIIFTPRRFSRVYNRILAMGTVVDSARGKTIEALNCGLALRDARDRVVTERWRKTNIPFAISEFLSIVLGKGDLKIYKNFIPTYGEYSSDGKVVDGSYGPRLIHDSVSQIEKVIEILSSDPNSRRAVMTIYNENDLLFDAGGLNTPCTLTLQFLIRDEQLVMITNMRSNDLIYGLTNDLIVFTMLQEYIARRLKVDTGTYYHNAGSMHIYEKHWDMLHIGEWDKNIWPKKLHIMPARAATLDEIQRVYDTMCNINDVNFAYKHMYVLSDYWKNYIYAAQAFIIRNEDAAHARHNIFEIKDETLQRVMAPWIPGLK